MASTIPVLSKHIDIKNDEGKAEKIADRLTSELVFALIGPVASGVTTTAKTLREILTKDYKYEVPEVIKVSDIIIQEIIKIEPSFKIPKELDRRISALQDAGNKLRNKYGNDFLAKKCIEKIASHRTEKNGYKDNLPLARRTAHIIDSIKHPEEIDILKEIYKEMFWVIGVFAHQKLRKNRLSALSVAGFQADRIMETDQGQTEEFGQKVSKTFSDSDFFIRNNHPDKNNLSNTLKKYLDLIFNTDIHTPTKHEAAMYKAAAAASRSACMSRQVGAAITNKHGELISVGWNDVPKFGGGLYGEDDRETDKFDHRCFLWKTNKCHNDHHKREISDEIINSLKNKGLIRKGKSDDDIKNALTKTRIGSLIEFSRSIHAEMEAIISAARNNKAGLIEGILYSTTFPCHSCARHIVAAGISEVYYIEPYPKSLASELHEDSISLESNDENMSKKVVFQQYEGVAPKNIFKLFNHGLPRKNTGKRIEMAKQDAEPLYRCYLDRFTYYEDKIVEELVNLEK